MREITLFLGIVDTAKLPERAGAAAEHEVTRPFAVPVDTAIAALNDLKMRSGPLVLALHWLALNRARLTFAIAAAQRQALMVNILLAIIGWDPKGWDQRFRIKGPQHKIRMWPERVGDPADIDYACVWRPPHGLLGSFRKLKAMFTLGAGVDDVLAGPAVPQVPIVRIVDPDLTMRMTEYVVLHVLKYHRQQRLYETQQRERLWRDHDQPAASDVAVGVLGLGVLGNNAAVMLQRLGFRVAGWSRNRQGAPRRRRRFSGHVGLESFPAPHRNPGLPVACYRGDARATQSRPCCGGSNTTARSAAATSSMPAAARSRSMPTSSQHRRRGTRSRAQPSMSFQASLWRSRARFGCIRR